MIKSMNPKTVAKRRNTLLKSLQSDVVVIPAKAGIQFRGSDGHGDFLRSHQYSIVNIQSSIPSASHIIFRLEFLIRERKTPPLKVVSSL